MSSIAVLIISLGVILVGAEVFVNGVEWLGKKLDLSEGAVGSVLAAVGTALPETMIPLIAILFGHGDEGHEIGIGAILGAPLMLSTLAMFVAGVSVLFFAGKRKNGRIVVADYETMSRDLGFFLIVFTAAVLTGFIPPELRHWQLIIAGFMIISYAYYLYVLVSEEREEEADHCLPPCYFDRRSPSPALGRIILQVVVALALIIWGANLFVGSVKEIAVMYGVPAFILALIIAPVATELPEKFNSIIWISRDKDTLALGNITGAMVFQSSLIPAIGIFLTDWQLKSGGMFLAAVIALASAGLILFELKKRKVISAGILVLGGIFYGIFIWAVLEGIIR
ncbi:cation:H+ antiporter [Thermosyntropha lipolytica DSM 11003]|uniref:Cation:H+ antiporter n=1 Tax=Thermosyntropha lipolytica DSM 11003 TaxID=1123382 RepID=A0A1M5NDX5_9FIRM|nr:sodium:calcium antiporter [Thermosyntropha lipolytica]SHG87721.1 cation:H+ antiporter [Thermosyntropha lipolytica DSM 11003]